MDNVEHTKAELEAMKYLEPREWTLGDVAVAFLSDRLGKSEFDRTLNVGRRLGVPYKISEHLVAAARRARLL